MIKDLENKLTFTPKLPPFLHQGKELDIMNGRKYYALFWEMGTGKSKCLIDNAICLFLKGEIDGVVIVSDNSSYLNWEYEEIPKHMMEGIPYRVAHWSSHLHADDRRRLDKILVAKPDCLDFICVNIEALASQKCALLVQQFIQNHYCMMTVDEATSIKNVAAKRTVTAINLGRQCDYRRVMTGTPVTQSPLDLWGMCEFLQPGCLGFSSFTAFRAHYARLTLQQFGRGKAFYQISGYKNLDQLSHKIAAFSSRYLRSECIDLPDRVYETMFIEQTPEQQKMYDDLKRTAVIMHREGLLTSESALKTLGKLQQINCGHLKLNDGTVVDVPNNRIPTLMEILDKIGDTKAIIWCAFRQDVELISRALNERKDGDYVTYMGGQDDIEKTDAVALFKEDPRVKWFVATQGLKGLTLVEANYTIYYSNNHKLSDRLQSEDRNYRIGQTRNVTVIDLAVPRSVDTKILTCHKMKKDLANQVLDLMREILADDVPMD